MAAQDVWNARLRIRSTVMPAGPIDRLAREIAFVTWSDFEPVMVVVNTFLLILLLLHSLNVNLVLLNKVDEAGSHGLLVVVSARSLDEWISSKWQLDRSLTLPSKVSAWKFKVLNLNRLANYRLTLITTGHFLPLDLICCLDEDRVVNESMGVEADRRHACHSADGS